MFLVARRHDTSLKNVIIQSIQWSQALASINKLLCCCDNLCVYIYSIILVIIVIIQTTTNQLE